MALAIELKIQCIRRPLALLVDTVHGRIEHAQPQYHDRAIMQTLWSRVAQVRGACRCPQCAPSVNGVTRRATTSATRRMPRYLTSSTFLYSGIFAAAATFDAGAKKQRREKWDKAIAEVKQELREPAALGQETADEFDLQVEVGLEEVEKAVSFKPFVEQQEGNEFQFADGQSKAAWPANTGAPLSQRLLPLNSIYAEDWQKDRLEMYRWTPKKQAMVQTSVDILLLELARELQTCAGHHKEADALPLALRSEMFQNGDALDERLYEKYQRMTILRRADVEMQHWTLPDAPEERLRIPTDDDILCTYQTDDENHFRSAQHELTCSLQGLFKQHRRDGTSKPSLLSKIMHSISHSSAPPELSAFNTLLLGFSQANEPQCFRHVLGSFRRCHMRSNEITLATVLNHFTKIDDPVRFAYWIELIRGGHKGLALARPDVKLDEESSKRLKHDLEDPDKIIQLPYPTPVVFGAIIAGVAKFTGFESALHICQSMGKEGWGLCMAGLTPLLHDCVRRGDWDSGSAVWARIQLLKAQSRRKDDSRWLTERIRLDTYAAMLRLCLKCDRRDVFAETWAAALRSHSGKTEKLRLLIKGSRAKQSEDEVEGSVVRVARDEKYRQTREERKRLAGERAKFKRELSLLGQRIVLPIEQIIGKAAETEALPVQQTMIFLREPLLRLQRFLQNEDVLAVQQGETFPQHQSTLQIAERISGVQSLLRNKDDAAVFSKHASPPRPIDAGLHECGNLRQASSEPAESPVSRSGMDYFEYAELDDPESLAAVGEETFGARFAMERAPAAEEAPQPNAIDNMFNAAANPRRHLEQREELYGLDRPDAPSATPLPCQDELSRRRESETAAPSLVRYLQSKKRIRKHESAAIVRTCFTKTMPRDHIVKVQQPAAQPSPAGKTKSKAQKVRIDLPQARQVSEEELQGLMAMGPELGEYEVRERPMSLRA